MRAQRLCSSPPQVDSGSVAAVSVIMAMLLWDHPAVEQRAYRSPVESTRTFLMGCGREPSCMHGFFRAGANFFPGPSLPGSDPLIARNVSSRSPAAPHPPSTAATTSKESGTRPAGRRTSSGGISRASSGYAGFPLCPAGDAEELPAFHQEMARWNDPFQQPRRQPVKLVRLARAHADQQPRPAVFNRREHERPRDDRRAIGSERGKQEGSARSTGEDGKSVAGTGAERK